MSTKQKPAIYKEMIDALVKTGKDGQGQIGSKRARMGTWNQNATAEFIPDQYQINLVLKRLSPADREILAQVLAQHVVTGVLKHSKFWNNFRLNPSRMAMKEAPIMIS